MIEMANSDDGPNMTLDTLPRYPLSKIALAVSGAVVLHVLVFVASWATSVGTPKPEEKKETVSRTATAADLVGAPSKAGPEPGAAVKAVQEPAAPNKAGPEPGAPGEAAAKSATPPVEPPAANGKTDETEKLETPPTLPKLNGLDDVK